MTMGQQKTNEASKTGGAAHQLMLGKSLAVLNIVRTKGRRPLRRHRLDQQVTVENEIERFIARLSFYRASGCAGFLTPQGDTALSASLAILAIRSSTWLFLRQKEQRMTTEIARTELRGDYQTYLRRQRGPSERTIFHSWRIADHFLEFRFGEEIGDLSRPIDGSRKVRTDLPAEAPR
jgi:hypothetical protein